MEKESSWNECLECSSALRITPDHLKANSLVETSRSRASYLNTLKLNETSANFIFEGYYASVTELIHALALINGFKISNHLCLGFYIRDVINNYKLFEQFDSLRFKRNSLVYFGKQMDFQIAKEAIDISKQVINELLNILPYGK